MLPTYHGAGVAYIKSIHLYLFSYGAVLAYYDDDPGFVPLHIYNYGAGVAYTQR